MRPWLARRGGLAIIPGRLIPGLRIPTTVVAAAFNVPLRVFLPAVATAAVVWGTFYIVLGAIGQQLALLGQHLLPDEADERIFTLLTMLALLGVAVSWHRTHPYRRR